jgi:ribose transport system ATP-binding protein
MQTSVSEKTPPLPGQDTAVPAVEMRNIRKSFPGVQALDGVDLNIRPGEVLALVGENGAGKSTLIKILCGAHHADAGEIFIQGEKAHIRSPQDARALGIVAIYQELSLFPNMSVAENILISRIPKRHRFPMVNWSRLRQQARVALDTIGARFDPSVRLGDLSVAGQQMVEIARAASSDARVIVMDEPTSALSEHEVETLFQIITTLKKRGVAIIYITHRLEEVSRVADRITVLRDGKYIGDLPIAEATKEKIVQMMVGRALNLFPKEPAPIGEEVMRVEDFSRKDAFSDISFSVRKGEILGVAGLMGAGRTEIARAIFGIDPKDSGEVFVEGKKVTIDSPIDAIRSGLGLVPEDRKLQALVLSMAVRENITLAHLRDFAKVGIVSKAKERREAGRHVQELDIRTPSVEQKVANLSGGNQQKVVIAKWLGVKPKVLMLDEPTRGIDVGAKAAIHLLMCKLAASGVGIVMISSELPEIMAMSDRIVVLHEGRITARLDREEATQDRIMMAATGG